MLGILYTFLCNIFFLAGYIVNPNSFPQPLTPEEEEQYFVDTDKWDAMYPEEAKERSARHWREMGLKE